MIPQSDMLVVSQIHKSTTACVPECLDFTDVLTHAAKF